MGPVSGVYEIGRKANNRMNGSKTTTLRCQLEHTRFKTNHLMV